MENKKFEHRSIIKFLVLEGQSPSNIHERMTAVYGDSAPSRTMLFQWIRRFKNGQLNIEDRRRSGQPISTMDEKNIKAAENLAVEDRRITIREIEEIANSLFKNMNELKHVKSFWLAMKKKEMIFFLILSLVTSHASVTINLNQNNHLNNGNELTLHDQRSLSKRSQNAKFCILFSGIIMVSF